MEPEVSEKDLLEKREESVKKFIKNKGNWIYYIILSIIVWIGVYIRTRNIPNLKDITTGTWTLGPDLDPFLFLRWAKYIVENGSLMKIDMMRYVPLGYNTSTEMKLLSYLIAWFHKFIEFFSFSNDVTYSAIVFPVFMTALTTIIFFIFVRKVFYKENKMIKNVIALIATLFLVLMPSILPRTIAGIPEKEPAAFFFMFLALYLFLEAFTSEKTKNAFVFGIFAGISSALMSLIWGGVTFLVFTIIGSVVLAFFLGKIDVKRFWAYIIWLFLYYGIQSIFSERKNIFELLKGLDGIIGISILIVIAVDLFIVKKNKFNIKERFRKFKVPRQIISLGICAIILIILGLVFIGPHYFSEQIKGAISSTIKPLGTGRFQITVAENRAPYFTGEWKNEFGPLIYDIPVFFWFFFIGSVMMFNYMIKSLKKKEKMIMTSGYFVFLFCLIFSRYAPHPHPLDGEGGLSLLMYFGGVIFFAGTFIYYYFKKYREGSFSDFKEFNFGYILYFIILTLAIIGARGGVRLVMILALVNPVTVSFLIVKISQKSFKEKEKNAKMFYLILAIGIILLLMFTAWVYYKSDKSSAENFAPGYYQWQWQKAMSWVRENTPTDSVFAHWWDYGYWIQSIGERATVLDGGNFIVYWDYLMGRHVLTSTSEMDALEFLYSHDTTHLLIDSTEIGKYTAFSSIGSNEDYDRFSWISTFLMDETKTQETSAATSYIYTGGFVLDEDLIWHEENKEILLPERAAGVGAVIINIDKNGGVSQPEAIFVYNNQQYRIPLRYVYYNNEKIDFESGLESGVFLFPKVDIVDNSIKINQIGAMFYLSSRTINSNLARLYLFNEEYNYFNMIHSEDSIIIESLKENGFDMGEFVYYNGFQGPIKIWKINYPIGMEKNEEYLQTDYPNPELSIAKPGKYSS